MTPTPDDLAAFEAAIISACAELEINHRWGDDYRRCVITQGVFVKYDSYLSLYPQYLTQKYVFQHAESDTSVPHVPKVLHFFHQNKKMAYLVMEYINLTSPPVPDLPHRAALALRWLRGLPAPPGHARIGPLGNGRARHVLFKDCTAPLSFSSIQAVERYLNTAIKRVPHRIRPAPVSISHERLVFTQSDMDESNFGVDDEGRTCLLDFGEVGLLPESFANYTASTGALFTVAVAQHLGWPPCSILATMSKINGCLTMLADPTLGLDENGYPKTS